MENDVEKIPKALPVSLKGYAGICRRCADLMAVGVSPKQAAATLRRQYFASTDGEESPYTYSVLHVLQAIARLPDESQAVCFLLAEAITAERMSAAE